MTPIEQLYNKKPQLKNLEENAKKVATDCTKIFIEERLADNNVENLNEDANKYFEEEYNRQLEKSAVDKADEHELWKSWKHDKFSPNSPHIEPLMSKHKKIITNYVKQYNRNPNIPKGAVHAEAMKLYVNALKKFDPSKGAQLSTYVHTWLGKLRRYVDSNANVAKIPEPRTMIITEFNRTKNDLYELNNKHPSLQEIHEEMNKKRLEEGKGKVTLTDLKRLQAEISKKTLIESGMLEDATAYVVPKELEVIRMLHYSSKLNPLEKDVFKKLYPMTDEGVLDLKAGLKSTQIAKQLNLSPAKMSRIHTSIKKTINEAVKAVS